MNHSKRFKFELNLKAHPRRPSLVVMVGDSSPRGCEFEPQCPIDYVKNVLVFDKICKKTPGWTAYIKKLSPQESSNKNQKIYTLESIEATSLYPTCSFIFFRKLGSLGR